MVATCRFMNLPAHFEPRFIDYAIDNLRVQHKAPTNGFSPVEAKTYNNETMNYWAS